MTKIRHYRESDFPMIESWWKSANEMPPLASMMPTDSSFVAEVYGVPSLAVTVYLTNTPELAYVENFIGNPAVVGDDRKNAALILSDHIAKFARGRGFKRLMCMTEKAGLKARYQELGYRPTLSNVTTFIRSL